MKCFLVPNLLQFNLDLMQFNTEWMNFNEAPKW